MRFKLGMSTVVLILKGIYILETTRTLHIQHEFSVSRYDIVCIWYNGNFLTRDAAKIKSKQFLEFGSRTKSVFYQIFVKSKFSCHWPFLY